jgi:hypothetical protein
MNYVLATKHDVVRWYVYKLPLVAGQFELIDNLDLKTVPVWGNKESAKCAAIALGLKTWRYVGL